MLYISDLVNIKNNIVEITDTDDNISEDVDLQRAINSGLNIRGLGNTIFQTNLIKKGKDINYIGDRIYPPVFDYLADVGVVYVNSREISTVSRVVSYPVIVLTCKVDKGKYGIAGGILLEAKADTVNVKIAFMDDCFRNKLGITLDGLAYKLNWVVTINRVYINANKGKGNSRINIVPNLNRSDKAISLSYEYFTGSITHHSSAYLGNYLERRNNLILYNKFSNFKVSDMRYTENSEYSYYTYKDYKIKTCTPDIANLQAFYKKIFYNRINRDILKKLEYDWVDRMCSEYSILSVASRPEIANNFSISTLGVGTKIEDMFYKTTANQIRFDDIYYKSIAEVFPFEANEIQQIITKLRVTGGERLVFTLDGVYLYREGIFRQLRETEDKELKLLQVRTKIATSDYKIAEITKNKVCKISVLTKNQAIINLTSLQGKVNQISFTYDGKDYIDAIECKPMVFIIPRGVKVTFNNFKEVPVILKVAENDVTSAEYLIEVMNKRGNKNIIGVVCGDKTNITCCKTILQGYFENEVDSLQNRTKMPAFNVAYGIYYMLSYYDIDWLAIPTIQDILKNLMAKASKFEKVQLTNFSKPYRFNYVTGFVDMAYTYRYRVSEKEYVTASFFLGILANLLRHAIKDKLITDCSQIAKNNINNLLNFLSRTTKCYTELNNYLNQTGISSEVMKITIKQDKIIHQDNRENIYKIIPIS